MPHKDRPAVRPAPRVAVVDVHDLGDLVRAEMADAVAKVLQTHAAEVAELKGLLVNTREILTPAEVGALLGGVSSKRVMDYVRDHGLPCHRPAGAALFMRAEVETWVTSRAAQTGESQG